MNVDYYRMRAMAALVVLMMILGGCGGGGTTGTNPASPSTAGTLDKSFGTGGMVVADNAAGGSNHENGRAITVDSNGRILVTGHSFNSSGNPDMVIWRYNADGTVDKSFGTNGIVVHDGAAGGNSDDFGRAVIVDNTSGKILVVGSSYNGSNKDMVIWRYNSNGAPDSTFGTNGIVVHDNAAGGSGPDEGNAIALDANGKILVTGNSWNGSDNDMVIWRFNTDGTIDTSFGNNGMVVHDNAAGGTAGNDGGRSITIDANNRILVTGYSLKTKLGSSTEYSMAIWCYYANGTLDTAFGTGGVVSYNNAQLSFSVEQGHAITIDDSGKIMVAGQTTGNSNDGADMALWRYNTDGSMDTSFGSNGIAIHNNAAGGGGYDFGLALVRGSGGKILVAGYSYAGSGDDNMIIWRYEANGILDTGFGTNGVVVHDNAASGFIYDQGRAAAIDANGRILVTGSTWNGSNNDMVIWCYLP